MKPGDLLYNALPYIYTFGGILTLLFTEEAIGRASGVLLVSAAMLIFHLRIEHRTRRAMIAEDDLGATQMILARVNSRRG